jgi:hypothetical protein
VSSTTGSLVGSAPNEQTMSPDRDFG